MPSFQFICSVGSDSLQPHESQHARPPCPSPTLGVYSISCQWSWWCYPAISSSVVPFSSCSQSLQASGSFPMSQLFALGGQNIGVSASASVLPMNTQDLSPLGWTGWIPLQTKGLSRVFCIISFKTSIFQCSVFFTVELSHPYMNTGKTLALTRRTFIGCLTIPQIHTQFYQGFTWSCVYLYPYSLTLAPYISSPTAGVMSHSSCSSVQAQS